MSAAAIAIGLLANVTARVVRGPAGGPSQSARRGNRTTVKEGSSCSDYSRVFPGTEDRLDARPMPMLCVAPSGRSWSRPPAIKAALAGAFFFAV